MVEICTFSLESCKIAQQSGANRIELCGGMNEGGTTPSAGLVNLVCRHISTPIRIMLRPRGGDFCYSENEWLTIYEDFEAYKNTGAEGFVIGALTPNGGIDIESLGRFLETVRKANNRLKFTFHRAFDVCKDPFEALEQLIDLGFDTILTSGQQNFAIDGISLLAELIKKANKRIEIMVGSGINAQNAEQFLNIGVDALHLTGKSIVESKMIYRKADVSMASSLPSSEFEIFETNLQKCQEIVSLIRNYEF